MSKVSFVKNIFLEYGADLRRFVALKLGNPHDAEDIVQDAFHNILRTESPEQLENPRAYLYQTAHNLALNRIRKNNLHQDYLSVGQQDEECRTPERSVVAQHDLKRLEASLNQLPDKCSSAFILSRLYAKNYKEIADELGVSVSSVEKYLIRAIQFLRDNYDENG